MIKIEFPADRPDIANHIGAALIALSHDHTHCIAPKGATPHTLAAAPVAEERTASDTTSAHTPPVLAAEVAEPPKPETTPPAPPAEAPTDTPRDTKGVPFNEQFCARAEQPFNSTGPKTGQWKKKRGLSEQEYDTWYASELAKVAPASGGGEEAVPPVNTAAAFGAPSPSLFDGPKDTGALMHWVSEKQAARSLTQDHVNQAFVAAGLSMADLFNKDAETVAANVGRVYAELVKVAQ